MEIVIDGLTKEDIAKAMRWAFKQFVIWVRIMASNALVQVIMVASLGRSTFTYRRLWHERLTFTLKHRPDQRVDMSPLVCHHLKDLALSDIAALTLQSGKRKLRVDELFTIDGSDTQNIIIKNSVDKLDFLVKNSKAVHKHRR